MTQFKELKQVREALDKWDNQGEINHEELCLFIEAARSYLELQNAAPTPEQTEIDLEKLAEELIPFDDLCYINKESVKSILGMLLATGRLKV